MCYIPPPTNALVVGDLYRMVAISADTGKTIHDRSNIGHSVAFSAKYHVLLAQAAVEESNNSEPRNWVRHPEILMSPISVHLSNWGCTMTIRLL